MLVVFVITVLALIGAYMTTMVTTSSLSAYFSFGSMQAWFAAQSAGEWGAWQVLHSGSGCGGFPATFAVDSGFSATVTCSANAVSEGPANYTVYDLVATAERGTIGEPGYVSRTVRMSVTDAP